MRTFKSGSPQFMAMLLVAVAALASGCATRGYVRSQVSKSAQDLNAKMDQGDGKLQQQIEANTGQIQEVTTVSQQNSQQLQTLDASLKQTDAKAAQALTAGDTAKGAADRAATGVAALDAKFQSRNHYSAVTDSSVQFKTGSATLEDTSKEALNQVVEKVKGTPDSILMMEGHADSTGTETGNFQLSEKRIDSIVRYMVAEQGLPAYLIYRIGFGEEQPVAPNDTPEGRERNRSVVIHVMAPQAQSASLR